METPYHPTGTTTELVLQLMAKPLENESKGLQLNTPGLLLSATLIADALQMGLMKPSEDGKKIELTPVWHLHNHPVAQSLVFALPNKYQLPENIGKPKTSLRWLTLLHNCIGLPGKLRKMAAFWDVWTPERKRVMRIFSSIFNRPTHPEARKAIEQSLFNVMRGECPPDLTQWLVMRYLQKSHQVYHILALLPKGERKAAAKKIDEWLKHPGEAVTLQLEKLGDSLRNAFDDNTTAIMVVVSSS